MVVTDTPLFSASPSTVSPLSSLIRRSSKPNLFSLTLLPLPKTLTGHAAAFSCNLLRMCPAWR
jgi:hypothetical protein